MSLDQTVVFHLNGIARAETVAKQLKKLLGESGRNPTLGFCREAVSRMYGHADWRALSADVGREASPEDSEVDAEKRGRRHEQQVAVLTKMGLSAEAAANIRKRLSPTGRSVADVEESLPVSIQQTLQYHPDRFMDALEQAARMKSELARHRAGKAPGKRSRTPNYSFAEVVDEVANWANRGSMLPLDGKLLFRTPSILPELYGSASAVRHGQADLLDASLVATELAKRDISGDVYSGEFSKDGVQRMYVHFGTNAFPSPWPGCGFEGCYVIISPPREDSPREIVFQLVAGPETSPDLALGEDMFEGPNYHDFVVNIRHIITFATARVSTGVVSLGDLDRRIVTHDHSDDPSAWSHLLRAPVNAAWNAVKAARDKSLPLIDGLLSDVARKSFVKLARARNEEQRGRVVEEITEDGEMVVRFLGGVPESALEGKEPLKQIDPDLSPVGNPAVWAEGYLRMALAAVPELRLVLARRAAAMSAGYEEGDRTVGRDPRRSEYTDADRHGYNRVQAAVLEQDALSQLGRWPEALAAAKACPYVPKAGWGVDYRLSALVAKAGTAADAEELVRRYDADTSLPSDWPIVPWCKALLAARFGTEAERDAAILEASAVDPEVLPRLLGTDREEWYDKAVIQYVERTEFNLWPFLVAGMLRDGWEAVPRWREVLSKVAVARQQAGPRARRA